MIKKVLFILCLLGYGAVANISADPSTDDADQPVASVNEIQPTNQFSSATNVPPVTPRQPNVKPHNKKKTKTTPHKKRVHLHFKPRAPNRHRHSRQHKNLLEGFIQADGILFGPNVSQIRSNGNIRRARLFWNTIYNPNLQTSIGINFAEHYFVNNFYVSYSDLKHIAVLVGQYSPNFGLNNSVATLANTLLESPMPVYTLSPTYTYAASVQLYNRFITYNIGANGTRLGQTVVGHMPFDITTRLNFVPIHNTRDVLDIGASSRWQYTDAQQQAQFGSIPDIYTAAMNTFISTPFITNTHFYNVYDLEAAWEHGPLEMQTEYLGTHVYRQLGLPTVKFYGYYFLINYFLTGESRVFEYPAAYYSGISKIRHRYGAWQVAAQFDNFSLNGADVSGGTEHNAVLGLNWYATKGLEFQFNYVHAWFRLANSIQNNQANIYALRLQYSFT